VIEASISEKSSIISTTMMTKTTKKPLPIVPSYKRKFNTHTRAEQESLTPLLSLRGGSCTSKSSYRITDLISPKVMKVSKSLPALDHFGEENDGSSQSLDTGAKAPSRVGWFLILWTFICACCSELGHGIKNLFALLWVTIILRLPFFSSKPKPKSTLTPTISTKRERDNRQMKKLASKQLKFRTRLTRSEIRDEKMQK